MGKGYNNFMCKKPFHPGSRENIKRVWMAEQRTEDEKKKQEELRIQYEKEQDLYTNRLLVSTESKEKLSLNFMYEAPKGVKERVKEDDEPEYKFEWQRNAPRESFAKNNMDIRDQPFGIQVRNVRCIKCHKWGHLNTDRECPEFSQSVSLIPGASKVNADEMMQAIQEDGLALKKTLNGEKFDPRDVIVTRQEEDPEMAFLRSLSQKQKKKLLKRLNKLNAVAVGNSKKAPKKHKHKKHVKKESRSGSSSESDTSEEDVKKRRRNHGSVSKERHSSKSHHKSKRSRSRSRSKKRDRQERSEKKDLLNSNEHKSKTSSVHKHRDHSRSPKKFKSSDSMEASERKKEIRKRSRSSSRSGSRNRKERSCEGRSSPRRHRSYSTESEESVEERRHKSSKSSGNRYKHR